MDFLANTTPQTQIRETKTGVSEASKSGVIHPELVDTSSDDESTSDVQQCMSPTQPISPSPPPSVDGEDTEFVDTTTGIYYEAAKLDGIAGVRAQVTKDLKRVDTAVRIPFINVTLKTIQRIIDVLRTTNNLAIGEFSMIVSDDHKDQIIRCGLALLNCLMAFRDGAPTDTLVVAILNVVAQIISPAHVMNKIKELAEALASNISDIFQDLSEGYASQTSHPIFEMWAGVKNVCKGFDESLKDRVWILLQDFTDKVVAIWAAIQSGMEISDMDFMTLLSERNRISSVARDTGDVISMIMSSVELVFDNFDRVCNLDFEWAFCGKTEAGQIESKYTKLMGMYPFLTNFRAKELKEEYGHTFDSFDSLLRDTIKEIEKLLVIATAAAQRSVLTRYSKDLRVMKAQRSIAKGHDMTKLEPIGILLYGGSSVGKSTVQENLAKTILAAGGYDFTPDYIAAANIAEKYDSNVTTDTKIIIADDAGNAQSKEDYSEKIIGWVNTQRRPIVKAGVEEKGNQFYDNIGCIVSTNDHSMSNIVKSVCPKSVFRRFPLHIKVGVKPAYRTSEKDPNSGIDKVKTRGLSKNEKFDIYEYTIYQFVDMIENNMVDLITENLVIVDNMFLCKELFLPESDAPILEQLKSFVYIFTKNHFLEQAETLTMVKEMQNVKTCITCGMGEDFCSCTVDPPMEVEDKELFDEQFGVAAICDSLRTLQEYGRYTTANLTRKYDELHAATTTWSGYLEQSKVLLVMLLRRRDLMNEFFRTSYKFLFLIVYSIIVTLYFRDLSPIIVGANIISCIALPFACLRRFFVYQYLRCEFELTSRPGILTIVSNTVAENRRAYALASFGVFGTLLSFYSIYKIFFDNEFEGQDYVCDDPTPKTAFEYSKDKLNDLPPLTQEARTTTPSNLLPRVVTHLSVCERSDGARVLALPMKSNFHTIPTHFIKEGLDYTFYPNGVENWSGKSKISRLSKLDYQSIHNKDMSIVHVKSAAPSADFTRFLPLEEAQVDRLVTVVYQDFNTAESELINTQCAPYYSRFGIKKTMTTSTGVKINRPILATLTRKTFPGNCGGIMVDSSQGTILGMHVAGKDHKAIYTAITYGEVCDAISKFDINYYPTSQEGMTVETDLGYELRMGDKHISYVDKDETVNLAAAKHTCINHGLLHKNGTPVGESPTTPFMKSTFIKSVEREFGESKHCPPQGMRDPYHARKAFTDYNEPVQDFSTEEVSAAVEDYLSDIMINIDQMEKDDPQLFEEIGRKLSMQEALDGINEQGVGHIISSTGIGFPYSGKKIKYMAQEPLSVNDPVVPREFTDDYPLEDRVNHLFDKALEGERSNVIVKTCTKANELLPKDKYKARPFQAMGTDFLVASKMMFAPVIRYMSRNKMLTECMLGINPHDTDWGELQEHLSHFNDDNCVAGDFKAYDRKMSSQITNGVAEIIMALLIRFGYDIEDQQIARGLLTEILYPNMLYFGQVVTLANSNPSGQPITTQVNSFGNSLYTRIVFRITVKKCKEKRKREIPFREACKLGTFGDDNGMNVHKDFPEFNHTAMANVYMDMYGMTYTMDVKDAESCPYQGIDEISFLKRKFKYHAELDSIVGPIEVASLIKSLHWEKKPGECPVSAAQQFMSKVQSSLKEAVYHGPELYAKFHDSFIAIRDDFPELTGMIIPEYKDQIKLLRPNFHPEEILDEEEETTFESQSYYPSKVNTIEKYTRAYVFGQVLGYAKKRFPKLLFKYSYDMISDHSLLRHVPKLINGFDYADRLALQRAVRVLSYSTVVNVGQLDFTPYKCRTDYLQELSQIIEVMELTYLHSFSAPSQALRMLDRLYDTELAFKCTSTPEAVREAPFTICLFGPSGVGKTGLAMKLANYLVKLHSWETGHRDVIVLNESDEFQSEYRSDIPVVIFDDVANANPSVVPSDPLSKIIDFSNNIPKKALNPHLSLKGMVSIVPKVLIVTTNRRSVGLPGSSFPITIERRMNLHYQVTQNSSFSSDDSHWNFRKFFLPGKEFDSSDNSQYVAKQLGLQMVISRKIINFSEVMEQVRDESLAFVVEQKQFVRYIDDAWKCELCSHNLYESSCRYCKLENEEEDDVYDSQNYIPVISPREAGYHTFCNMRFNTEKRSLVVMQDDYCANILIIELFKQMRYTIFIEMTGGVMILAPSDLDETSTVESLLVGSLVSTVIDTSEDLQPVFDEIDEVFDSQSSPPTLVKEDWYDLLDKRLRARMFDIVPSHDVFELEYIAQLVFLDSFYENFKLVGHETPLTGNYSSDLIFYDPLEDALHCVEVKHKGMTLVRRQALNVIVQYIDMGFTASFTKVYAVTWVTKLASPLSYLVLEHPVAGFPRQLAIEFFMKESTFLTSQYLFKSHNTLLELVQSRRLESGRKDKSAEPEFIAGNCHKFWNESSKPNKA